MTRTRKTRLVGAASLVALIALLASGVWIASHRETPSSTALPMELGVAEITARAIAFANAEYQGNPADVHSRKTTMGELNIISCSSLGAWVSRVYDRLQGELDWCNPNTPVWVVDLQGEFRQGATVTRALSIVLDGQGKFIRLGSDALTVHAGTD